MIAVVVATLNRPHLLEKLIENLLKQTIRAKIIIIDASDKDKKIKFKKFRKITPNIIYLTTKIKSAAIQRNIGLDLVPESTKYVAILDDDISIENNYLESMIQLLKKSKAVGISGLAIHNSQSFKTTRLKIVKRIFFLDSKTPGKVTAAGVNIPIHRGTFEGLVTSDWLIGCSVWEYSKIRNLRYQKNFLGQSLFEDVIFSLQASKYGKLLVDTATFLSHSESEIERPDMVEFYRMWVFNRFYVVRNLEKRAYKYAAFHWASFGKLLQSILELPVTRGQSIKKVFGLTRGYWDLGKEIIKCE